MLSIPAALKIFLAAAPTDMRKSHDGLAALVEHVLRENPLSGHLFVFRNKPGDRLKLLCWDTDGYALWYRRCSNRCCCSVYCPAVSPTKICESDWLSCSVKHRIP